MNREGEDRQGPRSVPERFEKFALSIERSGVTYRVRVIDSPVGPRPPVTVDFSRLSLPDESDIESPRGRRDIRRRETDGQTLRKEGELLFKATFTGGVADAFRASLERVRASEKGLLIQLHFDEAPETATLPWEALWDPTERTFLADLIDIPIVRGLSVTRQAPTVAPAVPPLRILALLPEPHGEVELSGAREWAQIRRHLGDLIDRGQVQVERVEPAGLKELNRRLDAAGCDVLHIVAHGSGGGGGRAGTLQLETAAGGVDEVSGADLARALERRQPPRLVVLSACHGASGAEDDAFDGLAQHLLARGVPAIVAMRTAISDAAAVEFASSLYRYLAAGRTAEAAVIEARRELGLSEQRTEWATPVLYLRGTNVRIFDTELVPLIDEMKAESETPKWFRFGRLMMAALVAMAIFGIYLWFGGSPSDPSGPEPDARCPSPSGFDEMRFIYIEPGVLEVRGQKKLVVEEAFCIAAKEVTRRDWQKIMGDHRWPQGEPMDWPANDVTFNEARALAVSLSAMDAPAVYRLPTEVEWEYAARASAQTAYFFGDDEGTLHRYGNCKNSLTGDGAEGLAAVGSYLPNPWGLYDVHGNVAEWVEFVDPSGRSTEEPARRFDEKKGYETVQREGGSFDHKPSGCAFGALGPVKLDSGGREETGVRLVREPTATAEAGESSLQP